MLRLAFVTGTEPGKWFARYRDTTDHGLEEMPSDDPFALLIDGSADLALLRLPDPRVGVFSVDFYDFATPFDGPVEKSYICRHRLVKKDAGPGPSEPVEPIVYYVDAGAPEPVRSALVEGASWWNAAFEAAGFVNATAGVGGPLVSAYGISQRIERTAFVPTAQAVLLAVNLTALLVKGLPDLAGSTWVIGFAAIVVGVLLGGPVSRRLDPVAGRRLMLAVAALGALATVVRGLVEL